MLLSHSSSRRSHLAVGCRFCVVVGSTLVGLQVIRNTAITTKNTFYTGLAVLKKKVNMLMLIMCVMARSARLHSTTDRQELIYSV